MKTRFEDAARDVEQTVIERDQPDHEPISRSSLAAAAPTRCRRLAAADAPPPTPEYRHPKKNWRLKHGAMPQWYKQRNGVRTKAQSGAARVARFRPPVERCTPRCTRRCADHSDPEDELAGTEQPFVSHLVELRDRLIRASIAVGVCFGVLSHLARARRRSTTCSRRRSSRTCRTGAQADRHQRDLAVPRAAEDHADGGVPAGAAVVLYQAWVFVAPGLYTHEKKLVLPLVVSSTLLFFVGIAFCYFFVFGKMFAFIQSFAPKSVTATPDIEAYLSFVLTMFIAFGVAFEVPIVVMVLVRFEHGHASRS